MPEDWRKVIIHPIFKGGNRREVQNYRGISLLNTAYKIFAMILERRLYKQAEEQGWLKVWQAGFREGRGTMDNV